MKILFFLYLAAIFDAIRDLITFKFENSMFVHIENKWIGDPFDTWRNKYKVSTDPNYKSENRKPLFFGSDSFLVAYRSISFLKASQSNAYYLFNNYCKLH